MSIATEISRIKDAKDAIRASIIAKGVNVPAAAKLDTYSDRIDEIVQTASGNMEVVTSSPSGTINAADNKFYMLSGDAGALVFNLPAMQQGGHGIYLLMTTASTSAVSFTATGGVTINFPSGFQVEADKCYLIDFEYAQSAWQVSVEEWFVNGGGGDLPANFSDWSFDDWGIMTSFTTSNNITTIPINCFDNNTKLQSAYMPNVSTIDQYAFSRNLNLQSAYMPNVSTIGQYAFSRNSNLQSAYMPNVSTIGAGAFIASYALSYVELNNNITQIPAQAFDYSGAVYVIDKETPPTLSNYNAFYNMCMPILVPSSAVDTYKSASGWSSLADRIRPIGWKPEDEGIDIANGYQVEAWYDTKSIVKVPYNEGDATTITEKVFTNSSVNKSSTIMIIGEGITRIYAYSTSGGGFANNSRTKLLILPSTLTGIGYRAIWGPYFPYTIVCKALTPPEFSIGNQILGTILSIYVPAESVDAYKSASGWSEFAAIIKPIRNDIQFPYCYFT